MGYNANLKRKVGCHSSSFNNNNLKCQQIYNVPIHVEHFADGNLEVIHTRW